MNDKTSTVQHLRERVRHFIQERDWEKYHTAKNLSMSIAVEAAELMELFQWKADRKASSLTRQEKRAVEHEVADIAIYVLDFCNSFGFDLTGAILKKLKHNERKYPALLVRGKSHKYTYYRNQARRKKRKTT